MNRVEKPRWQAASPSALHVGAAGELQHQHLVQARDRGEVEAVEALDRREPGLADAPLGDAPLAVEELELGEPQQVTGVVDAVPGALAGDLVVLPEHGRQLELLQVVGEEDLGRLGALRGRLHAARSESSAA